MHTLTNRVHSAIALTLMVAMLSLTACNSSDAPTGSGGGGTAGIAVSGTAAGPSGAIAKITSPSKSWFASLFQVAEAFAQQVTGWSAVPNATVRVFRIDNDGNPVGTTVIPPVTTAADGSFSLTLPTGTVLDSTLVAQVENDPAINDPVAVGTPNTYSAFLVNTTVALNPAVEAVTRAIVNDLAPLSNFTNAEVTQIYSGITTLVAQNPPPPPVDMNAVTTNFGAAIASAVNATSGTTAGAPVILTSTLVGGTAGTSNTTTLIAVGGIGTLTWTLDPTSGPLPNGVTLGANGQLSGIPQQNGTFPLKVRVTDTANPAQSATKDLSLSIAPATAPMITTTSPLPNGVVNQPYSQTFAATGGTGTLTWTSTGALPNGLVLSTDGILSGTPLAGSQGDYSFSVIVTDSTTPVGAEQSNTKPFDLKITAAPLPLLITTPSLPNGAVNTLYTQSLAATGGTLGYTWSVVPGSGSLAPLALSAAGVISGTSTDAATLNFTVQVTDATNLTATKILSITITNSGNTTVPNSWVVNDVGIFKSATATYNPQNELIDFIGTVFGQTNHYERGTMVANEVYFDQFVQLSRWNNGTGQRTFGTFVTPLVLSANQGLHNSSGVARTFASLATTTGIVTYNVVASTQPTFDDGSAAPGVGVTGTVQVNFTGVQIGTEGPTKKVSFNLTFTSPNGVPVTCVSGGSITDPANLALGTVFNDGSIGANGVPGTGGEVCDTITGAFFGGATGSVPDRIALGIRDQIHVTGVGVKDIHAALVLAKQ